jgi:uncharacterized RDD family membrane protein YckC
MARTVIIHENGQRTEYELAGFFERFAARIIDGLIMIIPGSFIPIIAPWIYWALMHSGREQATVGQRALDIKVVDADGRKVDFGQATGRFFGQLLSAILLFIGYLVFFFSEKNQCLHDSMSGTYVVKARPVRREYDILEELVG